MSRPACSTVDIMYFCFGGSIHARRRAMVFIADPRFRVHVVSDAPYDLPGCASMTTLAGGERLAKRGYRHTQGHVAAACWAVERYGLGPVDDQFGTELLTAAADFASIRALARRIRPGLIIQQTLLYPCYTAFMLDRSIPRLITFWNGDVIWWAEYNELLRRAKKHVVQRGIQQASAITVNSEEAYRAVLGYGVGADKVHRIRYPGIDLDRFHPPAEGVTRQSLKASLGLPAGPLLFCPRGFAEYQNPEVILAAVAKVAATHPDIFALFANQAAGDRWPAMQKLASQLGIADRIGYTGHVAWETMPALYAAADMVISVSSKDSQPNSMLEAMACGTPVILGDIPPIREWIEHNANGLLNHPTDVAGLASNMATLLSEPDVGIRIAKLALESVRAKLDSKLQCSLVCDLAWQTATHASGV